MQKITINQGQIYFFKILAFLGIFTNLYTCITRVSGVSLYTVSMITLIAFVDIFFYAYISPLPWKASRNQNSFTLRAFFSALCCSASIALLAFVNMILGNLIEGINGTYLVSLVANFKANIHGMMIFGYLIFAWEELHRKVEAAEEKTRIAQRHLLETQAAPHVLYNSLSGLVSLIEIDVKKGIRGLLQLADLLRDIARARELKDYSLADERDLIENYLGIEEIRLVKRLKVVWNWDFGLESFRIPPLLVQPLVENAIKHGISKTMEGGSITISLFRNEPNEITVSVANTGQLFRSEHTDGIGLENLRQRLACHFENSSKFSIIANEGKTTASIIFQTSSPTKKTPVLSWWNPKIFFVAQN